MVHPAAMSDTGDAEKFVVDLKQPGIGDGVKLGINIPKEFALVTSSNKKLLETSALVVLTRSY